MNQDFGQFLAANPSERKQAFEPMMPSISQEVPGSADVTFATIAGPTRYCGTIRVPSEPMDALIELTHAHAFFIGFPTDLIGKGTSREELRLIEGVIAPISNMLPQNQHLVTMLRKRQLQADIERMTDGPEYFLENEYYSDLGEMIDAGEQGSADLVSLLGHFVLPDGDFIHALYAVHGGIVQYALLKSGASPLEAERILATGSACIDFVGTPTMVHCRSTDTDYRLLLGSFRQF